MRENLSTLSELLRENGHVELAVIVEDAVAGDDRTFGTFLVSNYLRGGSGSIADCGGLTRKGERTERRQRVEDALISIGTEQMRLGKVNPRTSMWVSAFSKWKAMDI